MKSVNEKIATNLISRVNKLTIATRFKQTLIMDISKEVIKANSIDEFIDNNFIYETEQFINNCNNKALKANIYNKH